MSEENLRKLRIAFSGQRSQAKHRGIEFLFTFEQWFQIWVDSGHLHERGCKKGCYVMARIGDRGPYSIENVEIITQDDNHRQASVGTKRSEETKRRMSEKAKNLPPRSAEHRKNISIGRRGVKSAPASDERKRKIGAAVKSAWDRKRALNIPWKTHHHEPR